MSNAPDRLAHSQTRVNAALDRALRGHGTDRHPALARLGEALRYSVLQGGKRIRPALLYASVEACTGQAAPAAADTAAAALELIHAYSLVHDDLPAMDNDDLRRGQPTCHRAFDEATAILAGDTLQTLAFGILAEESCLDAGTRLELIRQLARGAGVDGMCGGQMIDLQLVAHQPGIAELELMHRLKTGGLIEAAIGMGACIAGAGPDTARHLTGFARAIGLAFQVHDDILDVTGDTATLGKPQGSDEARHKPTYPALLGLEAARELATRLENEALAALDAIGPDAQGLRELATWIIRRNH